MNALARIELPDWPRLMSRELAAAYLSIGTTTLDGLGLEPRRIGRKVLYDRHDLDRHADALAGQPLEGTDAERQARDVQRQFFEDRRSRGERGKIPTDGGEAR